MSLFANRKRTKEQLNKQIKLGLCHNLGCKNKPFENKAYCIKHLKSSRKRAKDYYKYKLYHHAPQGKNID